MIAARIEALGRLTKLAIGFCVVFVLWQVSGWGSASTRVAISDLAPLPLEVAAVVAAIGAARASRHRPKAARSWTLIACASGLYLAGDALWAWFEVVRDTNPFPSLADAMYLAYYPVLLAGVLGLSVHHRTRMAKVRLVLDVAIVVVAGTMAVWYFVLGPTVRQAAGGALATTLSVAYPVGDLVIILGVAAAMLSSSVRSVPLRLLAASLAAFVIGDLGFGYLSLADRYDAADWPDAFWMIALTLMVAAADHQRCTAGEGTSGRENEGPAARVSALPYMAIAGAYTLLLSVGRGHASYPLDGLLLGGFALTAVVVLRQLTAMRDNRKLVAQLHHLAVTDSLTGLRNRRRFLEQGERTLLRLQREGRSVSLVMIDVDHFKAINDTWGHGVGDEALRWIAAQGEAVLRPNDVLGRYGGDELVALLPDASLDEAVLVAERLRVAITEVPTPLGHGPERLSLSLGAATAEPDADLSALLRAADVALYVAKRDGRGCVRPATAVA
jgi:diguanylate cyclase